MLPAQRIRDKFARQELVTGVLATNHVWPGLIELCQQAEVDYLIVDQEHGPYHDGIAAEICRIGRLTDFAVLVRTISTQYDVVRRAMDMGPCGLMFPCVDDTAALDEARDAIWMPPRGRRRPGGPANAWLEDYQLESFRQAEDAFLVLPQVESRTGLANAKAIAAHDIVTAMAIGPYDLSGSLGCLADMDHPDFLSAFTELRSAADAVNKPMWMIGDGQRWVKEGIRLICFCEPTMLLGQALSQAVSQMRGL